MGHTYRDRNKQSDSNSGSYGDCCLTVMIRREQTWILQCAVYWEYKSVYKGTNSLKRPYLQPGSAEHHAGWRWGRSSTCLAKVSSQRVDVAGENSELVLGRGTKHASQWSWRHAMTYPRSRPKAQAIQGPRALLELWVCISTVDLETFGALLVTVNSCI